MGFKVPDRRMSRSRRHKSGGGNSEGEESRNVGGFAPRRSRRCRFALPPRIFRIGLKAGIKGRGRHEPPPSGFEVRDGAQVASQRCLILHADAEECIQRPAAKQVVVTNFMLYDHMRLAVLKRADKMNLVFAYGRCFSVVPECPFKSTSGNAR